MTHELLCVFLDSLITNGELSPALRSTPLGETVEGAPGFRMSKQHQHLAPISNLYEPKTFSATVNGLASRIEGGACILYRPSDHKAIDESPKQGNHEIIMHLPTGSWSHVQETPQSTSTYGRNDPSPSNLSGNLIRSGTTQPTIDSRASTISFAFGVSNRGILSPVRFNHCRCRCHSRRCIINQFPNASYPNKVEMKKRKRKKREREREMAKSSSPSAQHSRECLIARLRLECRD